MFIKSCQTLIYIKITLNVKFNENQCITSLATFGTNILAHTHTQREREPDVYQKKSNRGQGIPKRVKTSKNGG